MEIGTFLGNQRQVVITCKPDETIDAIVMRLTRHNIGAMPVCDARGAVTGIISERDLIHAFAAEGANLLSRFVRDLMTRTVMTCAPDTTMSEAERKMHERRIRHLPVVEEGRVVGMLSIRDVVAWRLSLQREEILVLRDAVIAARHS